jgi:hypothetical protein
MGEVLASAVVVLGVIVIWCTDLPRDSVARRLAAPVLRPARWLGLGHTWKLFAPRPARGHTRLVLEVVRADGSVDEVAYPPPSLEVHGRPIGRAGKLRRTLLARNHPGLRASFARFVVAHDVPQGPDPVAVRYRVERRRPPPFAEPDRTPPPARTTRPYTVRLDPT